MSDCTITPENVTEAFLAAPPLIASEILDLTVKHPTWMSNIYDMKPFPLGNGSQMTQLIFRGAMPQIERGLDAWMKISNVQGCDPCQPSGCGYNTTKFGGTAMERRIVELMYRDFNSPHYCVKDIQTTAHFEEVFGQIVKNLYRQTTFFKEMNIGQNILTMLAKKYVVDSGGAQPNTQNPYVYRNIGTARVSNLNIHMLEFFYEWMRRAPDVVPYDVVQGSPVFALSASHQTLSRLYRDDPVLRQDVRFSAAANDLLTKYNFMSTIRGMFIPAPILYPRRFNILAGEPIEVLPFVNGVPAEIGEYTDINPNYEACTHEEVMLYGKYPFCLFYQPTAETLGQGTQFGPENSWFNKWDWINIQTVDDYRRRSGFFATEATFGISQQFSQGILAILVERVSPATMAMFNPEPVCPPVPVVCNNDVPAVGCPCPLIEGVMPHPLIPDNYFIKFAVPVTGNVGDPVSLGIDTGGFLVGTLVAISADGRDAQVQFAAGTDLGSCDRFTTVFCDNTLGCSASVMQMSDCRAGETGQVKLTLSNPIRATTAGDVIIAYMGDGTEQQLEVVAVDMANNLWYMEYAPGFGPTDDPTGAGATNLEDDMACDRHGIHRVCVPPTTNPDCPDCGGPVITQC